MTLTVGPSGGVITVCIVNARIMSGSGMAVAILSGRTTSAIAMARAGAAALPKKAALTRSSPRQPPAVCLDLALSVADQTSITSAGRAEGEVVMKPEIIPVERAGRGIFTRRWSPAGSPRAAVMIAHGLAEHGARYARLAAALTAAGIVVYAHDHRGHGPACPPADLAFFADRDGWRECLDDIHAVAQAIRAAPPGVPLVV